MDCTVVIEWENATPLKRTGDDRCSKGALQSQIRESGRPMEILALVDPT